MNRRRNKKEIQWVGILSCLLSCLYFKYFWWLSFVLLYTIAYLKDYCKTIGLYSKTGYFFFHLHKHTVLQNLSLLNGLEFVELVMRWVGSRLHSGRQGQLQNAFPRLFPQTNTHLVWSVYNIPGLEIKAK